MKDGNDKKFGRRPFILIGASALACAGFVGGFKLFNQSQRKTIGFSRDPLSTTQLDWMQQQSEIDQLQHTVFNCEDPNITTPELRKYCDRKYWSRFSELRGYAERYSDVEKTNRVIRLSSSIHAGPVSLTGLTLKNSATGHIVRRTQFNLPYMLEYSPGLSPHYGAHFETVYELDTQGLNSGHFQLSFETALEQDATPPAVIDFVIKGKNCCADLLFIAPNWTNHTYNQFAGASFYRQFFLTETGAISRSPDSKYVVALGRPFDQKTRSHHSADPIVAGLAWAERNGFSYDVWDDTDLHHTMPDPSKYKAVVLIGHNEYWTWDKARHLDAYLNAGGRLINLSGNTLWGMVTFDPEAQILRIDRNLESPNRTSTFKGSGLVRDLAKNPEGHFLDPLTFFGAQYQELGGFPVTRLHRLADLEFQKIDPDKVTDADRENLIQAKAHQTDWHVNRHALSSFLNLDTLSIEGLTTEMKDSKIIDVEIDGVDLENVPTGMTIFGTANIYNRPRKKVSRRGVFYYLDRAAAQNSRKGQVLGLTSIGAYRSLTKGSSLEKLMTALVARLIN